ncbi:MAG: hypothetical protein ABSA03_10320 [Streptosporangiaceae bacterium]|jgi:hypothetical protein
MRTHAAYDVPPKSQRVADLKTKAEELERELLDARISLEREIAQPGYGRASAHGRSQRARRCAQDDASRSHPADLRHDNAAGMAPPFGPGPEPSFGYGSADAGDEFYAADDRTEVIVSHGRRNAYRPGRSRGRIMAGGAAFAAVIGAVLATMVLRSGPSWPTSVATVQTEAATACQNPDVASEPGEVNFACAKATRQILWVLALMTSGDDPNFVDAKTGRRGLEPIAPAQGGEVAWSLNLHHPYNPANPVDSLEVAARAINNIIGGATTTSAHGKPIVQPGLEGHPANCARYTGSAALTARAGFPSVCARPVASPAGQAALVADVYRKWVVGASSASARDAAVLFQNANDPAAPRVQAILRYLSYFKLPA